MKVFIDEDCGTGIPKSLRLVKVPKDDLVYPCNHLPIKFGTKDPVWLAWAGNNGYLVISNDRQILENPNEFTLITEHNLGIVFVDNGEYPVWKVLRMLLTRWEWFEEINRAERPFVYLVGLTGKPVRYDLEKGPRPPRPLRSQPLKSDPAEPPPPRPNLQVRLF